MAMTHRGSGIWSYIRRSGGAIFCDTRPETISRSDWRGDARKSSMPHRDRSYWPAPDDIISIAQQASPNVAGHIDCLRAQPTALSNVVRRTPRSTSSSTSSGVLPRCTPSKRSTGTTGPLKRTLAIDDLLGFVRRDLAGAPVEPALAPDVDVRHEHEPDEYRHLDQPEQPERAERDRPREQEDRLDVEDDEQHRHQVELDAEAFPAGQPDRVVAALVGRQLHGVRTVRPKHPRGHQGAHGEHPRQDGHHDDRQVVDQHDRSILRSVLTRPSRAS